MPYDDSDYDETRFKEGLVEAAKPLREYMQDLEEIWSPSGQGGIPYIRSMNLIAEEASKIVAHAMVGVLSYTAREDVQFTVAPVGHVHEYAMNRKCGAQVCWECRDHKGMARCFCGWSGSGGDGRQELIEMGENVEEDY